MIDFSLIRKIDLNLITVFLCVYKHSSITNAAKELHTSAPNISQSLNRLKDYLKDPLFLRTGKGISPTPFCDSFYHLVNNNYMKFCESIVLQQPSNYISIYAPAGYMIDIINKQYRGEQPIEDFCILHHDVIVDASEAHDLFSFKKADIVLTCQYIELAGIASVELPAAELILACSKSHPKRDEFTMDNIFEENFISTLTKINEPGAVTSFISQLKDRNIIFKSTSQDVNISYIEKSRSLGFVSKNLLMKISDIRNITSVKLDDGQELTIKVKVYANYKKTSAKDKRIMRFIDLWM